MAKCATCGNEYERSFEVVSGSQRLNFDSFECAIQALAPRCGHCQCIVIGHGVDRNGTVYCCDHCARHGN